MKSFNVIKCFVLLSTISIFVGCATGGSKSDIQIAKPHDYTLKNGLKVLVMEDHSLPYLSVGLMIKTGSSADPLGKTGLTNLTADLLDRGSRTHSATEIADLFASYGTGFTNSVNYDFSYFSTAALSKDQVPVLKLFFEVINTPAFDKAEIARAISEAKADVKRSYDQPPYVAGRLFSQYLYGPHPYGRSPAGTYRDIENIKNQDIKDLYQSYYRPNNASLVLVGDVQPDLIAMLDTQLAGWQSQPTHDVTYPALSKINGGQLLLVDRDDLKQTEVRIGHFGIQRKNDDYQTIVVADVILSDGFSSRLMREIRVKRGLTYGISSDFEARKDIGPFFISSATRHEKVGELVKETLNVLKEFKDKGVTDKEVEEAKGFLRGSFPRKIETADQLANLIMGLRFFGLDESYLQNYINKLDAITAKDVNQIIKKYYHPDSMKILVYGPKDQLLDQLRPIGAVEVKSYKELVPGI